MSDALRMRVLESIIKGKVLKRLYKEQNEDRIHRYEGYIESSEKDIKDYKQKIKTIKLETAEYINNIKEYDKSIIKMLKGVTTFIDIEQIERDIYEKEKKDLEDRIKRNNESFTHDPQ